MIEASRRELQELGFVSTPGFVLGMLFKPDYYMIWEERTASRSISILMRESETGIYSPHRAEDSRGRNYGEDVLLYGKLESLNTQQLIEFMRNPTKTKRAA